MKVLITGANGLLGQKLTKLLTGNVTVIATARQNSPNILDITNEQQVHEILQHHKPDVVINTAAMTNVDQCESEKEACWKLNVTAVSYLIDACRDTGAYLLHISTDFIFDGSHGPLTEEEVPNPVNYYGESKLAAEKLVQESDIPWGIARTILVYGIVPGLSRSNIILWVKNSLEAKKEINVVNDQWRTPTLAEDLAMGCWLIAQNKAPGIFNIAGKDLLTPYEMAMKTAAFFDLDVSLIHETDGSQFSQPAKRPPKTGLIIDKARKQLGYVAHSFEEGLALLKTQMKRT